MLLASKPFLFPAALRSASALSQQGRGRISSGRLAPQARQYTIAMTDLCTNQGFKSIIPKSEFGTAFVYYFLKENRQLLESRSSGTTFMEISGNVLKAIPVSIPPEELTKKFSSMCEPIFAYQEQIEAEILHLLELQRTMVSQISSR